MYDKLKSEGRNFEVVFVSSDRSIDSFGQYFKTMPWLAIPYDDARIRQLKSIYDVYGKFLIYHFIFVFEISNSLHCFVFFMSVDFFMS